MSVSTTGPADGGFYKAATPIPHGGRAKRILREHPEVRRLIGRNAGTFWITAGIVAFQVAVAWLLRGSPWWLIVAHGHSGRLARRPRAVGHHPRVHPQPDLPVARGQHADGHARQFPHRRSRGLRLLSAVPHEAPRLPRRLRPRRRRPEQAGRRGSSATRHGARRSGSCCFPIVQLTRPPRLKELRPIDRWVVVNFIVQMSFNAAVWFLISPAALGYLGYRLSSRSAAPRSARAGSRSITRSFPVRRPTTTTAG